MPAQRNVPIEFRSYSLSSDFPIVILTGDIWRISDVPSPRLHFHNCLEIGICESDSGTMRLNGSLRPFQAGDITFIGTDVVHTTWSAKGTASKWSYIYVDLAGMLGRYFPLSVVADDRKLLSLAQDSELILKGAEYPEAAALIRGILHEMTRREDGYENAVRGLFLALLTHMVNIMHRQSLLASSHNAPSDSADRTVSIMPALRYIRTNYEEDFPMGKLADLCHMSPTSFRRIFSSTMGTSPLSYLSEVRIRNAALLLRATDDSILSISVRVGYQSVSSFNRHFLDIMGTSPRQWRQKSPVMRGRQVLRYAGWTVPEKL